MMTVQTPGNTEIRRMWKGGPLRRWAEERPLSSWIPYATGGYAGPYVCEICRQDVVGVYRCSSEDWRCAKCRVQAARTGKEKRVRMAA